MNITIDNHTYNGELLGSGAFSSAFLVNSDVFIVQFGTDDSKKVLCSANKSLVHNPQIEYLGLGFISTNGKPEKTVEHDVFRMPKYYTLSPWRHEKQFREMETLCRLNKHQEVSDIQNALLELPLSDEIKSAFRNQLDLISGYSDTWYLDGYEYSWYLDIAGNNCSVDKKGNLILRDLFVIE
jgi:hypothetical protein